MKKKVIIIEGPDNCGKDTLINELIKDYKCPVIIHAMTPPSDVRSFASLFGFYNDGIIQDTLKYLYDKEHDAIIHNRSMYGEFVYGPKYRGQLPSETARLISKLETMALRTFLFSNELYFILLTSSSANLLVNNDDGKSISNKAADIEDEINAFDTIFNLSRIENKQRFYVNDGDCFIDKNVILNKVKSFIAEGD